MNLSNNNQFNYNNYYTNTNQPNNYQNTVSNSYSMSNGYQNNTYNNSSANGGYNNGYYSSYQSNRANNNQNQFSQNNRRNYNISSRTLERKQRKIQKAHNIDPNSFYRKEKVNSLRSRLHFPLNLFTGRQLLLFARMGTSPKDIMSSALLTLLFIIVSVVFFIIICVATGKKFMLLGAILGPLLFWFLSYNNTKNKYKVFRFKRQLLFNKFTAILDLSEIKRGLSVNELLSKAAIRVNNKELRNAVDTMNSRIQDNTESKAPYMEFARDFSGTPDARLFMLSVYSMSQGNYDDSEIKSLKRNASKNLARQSRILGNKKVSRFYKLRNTLFTGLIVFLLIYIILFIITVLKHII